MIARHVHDALAQVHRLQDLVLEKRMFQGYSGRARILSGLTALGAAAAIDSHWVPRTDLAHLAGWGLALVVALLLNYGALAWWFLFDPTVRRNPRLVKPAVDAIPALGIGAVLSVALVLAGEFRLLFGVWMALYGLAQVAYRQSLPPGIYGVGVIYMACGAVCLLAPCLSFTNPWPMGLTFFFGELAGGTVLLKGLGGMKHEGQGTPEAGRNSMDEEETP